MSRRRGLEQRFRSARRVNYFLRPHIRVVPDKSIQFLNSGAALLFPPPCGAHKGERERAAAGEAKANRIVVSRRGSGMVEPQVEGAQFDEMDLKGFNHPVRAVGDFALAGRGRRTSKLLRRRFGDESSRLERQPRTSGKSRAGYRFSKTAFGYDGGCTAKEHPSRDAAPEGSVPRRSSLSYSPSRLAWNA
jgi:hypothetical protein